MSYDRVLACMLFICATAVAQDDGRYIRPEDAPYFREPTFISLPTPRAYPGVEYNIRAAVIGGTWPYRFELKAAPMGMAIDAQKGTITWKAPHTPGNEQVTVVVKDMAGRKAEQSFSLTVGKEGFYFVSPDGSDANPGIFEKPWKTVVRAAQSVENPADSTLYVRAGIHAVQAEASPGKKNVNVLHITENSPRRWVAWPGERPVIDLGWTEELWKATLAIELVGWLPKGESDGQASNKPKPQTAGTTQDYGHRIFIDKNTDNLLFDGLEVKNANYYMFVMWHGQRQGLTWRRCSLHHLYADGCENPSFIFGFAAERKYERVEGKTKGSLEELCPFGRRPEASPYLHTIVQECTFADRPYDTTRQSGHGGGITWYTTQGSLIEDNRFERMEHGITISDKDNGWENTYRNNLFLGDFIISAQGCTDGIDIHHNFIDGHVMLGKQPGWVRNIWFHHNAMRGALQMMGGGALGPDTVDPAGKALDGPTDPDCQALVRDYPRDQRLIFAWANIIALPPTVGAGKEFFTSRIPAGIDFANRYRFVYCDGNLVDEAAMIKAAYTKTVLKWKELRACGIDVNGIQGKITLDAEGRLPTDSPWRATYGRDAGMTDPAAVSR